MISDWLIIQTKLVTDGMIINHKYFLAALADERTGTSL